MKRVKHMDTEALFKTDAYSVYCMGIQKPQEDPTRLFLRLMHHAKNALWNSRNIYRDIEGRPTHEIDYSKELNTNPEFHGALECMKFMLKNPHLQSNPVQPQKQIARKDGKAPTSPFDYADKLEKMYPGLGLYLTTRLITHQKTLDYKANNPTAFMPYEARIAHQRSSNQP